MKTQAQIRIVAGKVFFLLLVFTFLHTGIWAASISSIGSGNWTSTAVWSSGSVPIPTDAVSVSHEITLNTNITVSSPGSMTINLGAALIGNTNITIASGATLVNYGYIDCKKITNNGTFINYGTIYTSNNFSNSGHLINCGLITVGTNFNNNSGVVSGPGGSLISENNVINNAGGYISEQFICNVDGETNPLISNSGSIDSATVVICEQPLFVDLTAFEAVVEEGIVSISWTTASERNSNYFRLERSVDKVLFYEISTVDAAGISSEVINYQITDQNPLPGTSYYRLAEIDYEGNEKYSEIIEVSYVTNLIMEGITVYPNPASGTCTILGVGHCCQVRLLNSSDMKVTTPFVRPDNSSVQLDLSNLGRGVYLVEIKTPLDRIMKKLVVY